MDKAIAEIDANKDMPADQKDMWKKILTSMKEFFESPMAPVAYALSGVFGRNHCCRRRETDEPVRHRTADHRLDPGNDPVYEFLLLSARAARGHLGLVVLSRPDVKAAIAAKRSGGNVNPDDQYMR